MRKPETIERLYLDFDGFFASVEQQCDKSLRGRPVCVVPFAVTDRTVVIAIDTAKSIYEQKASGLVIYLLQASLVFLNTRILQTVQSEPAWHSRMPPKDFHGLTPMICSPSIPIAGSI